jgi:hypothetical protein
MSADSQSLDDTSPSTQAGDVDAKLDAVVKHVNAGLLSTMNAQWEDAHDELDKVKPLLADLPEEGAAFLGKFHQILQDVISGLQMSVEATDEDALKAALKHLTDARQQLRDLGEAYAEYSSTASYQQMRLGLEMHIASVARNLAVRLGDEQQAARLSAQQQKTQDEIFALLPPDDPMRNLIQCLRLWNRATPLLDESSKALAVLDLDGHLRYVQEANDLFQQAHEQLEKVPKDLVLFAVIEKIGRALTQVIAAQKTYAHVLHTAVTGDVVKGDLDRLNEADRQLVEANRVLAEVGGVYGTAVVNQKVFADSIAIQRQRTQNLRYLCERSLSPRVISRGASPRLMVYFVGTFLVLLFALRVSGLISQLDLPAIGLLVLMSFIACLVSVFGFEALRFVPLFETFKGFGAGKGA